MPTGASVTHRSPADALGLTRYACPVQWPAPPLRAAPGGPTPGLLEFPFEAPSSQNQPRFGMVRKLQNTICAAQLLHAAQSVTIDRNQRSRSPEYAAAPKLVIGNSLFESITALLRLCWSPQQIAAHLAKLHPSDSAQRASHETIYNVIYAQPRGELRKELIACLRMARAKRWPRSKGEDRRGHMADMLSIHVRPPEVADRQFPGHWEGDLIKGALNQSAVGTLVERNTRFLMLVKLPHPNPSTAAHVLQAFTDKLNAIAKPMRKTLTYDRGKEMSHHQQLTTNTGIAVYFCDTQRGTNENTNGLVRQFLPKGTDLSVYSKEQLDEIADLMNGRPRKTLDWCSPHEVYSGWLAKFEEPPQLLQ